MALQARPPVVTIMGHVDHGKTTLLDTIRQAHVAAGEAGGITQHIGAYQASWKNQIITFIDTPGHAAFREMRSRGAQVTDIVILVVAADDGVMPQTIESIQHIHASKTPFVVCITKIDAPGADPEKVKAQLTEHEVFVRGYGGDTDFVLVSAKEKLGIDDLLETLITFGEILELQSDPEAPFTGVVIESRRDPHQGPIASVLVRQGTLQVRDTVFLGSEAHLVRTIRDALGQNLPKATPSMPVEVTGWKTVPSVGDVVAQNSELSKITTQATADYGFDFDINEKLLVILKADTQGSLEALQGSLNADEVKIIGSGLGEVTESDLMQAETSKASIIAFNSKVKNNISKQAERMGVTIYSHRIIYELLDAINEILKRKQEQGASETITAEAEILQIFPMKGQLILGCKVLSGTVRLGDKVRVWRGEQILDEAKIGSLKQGKTDVPSTDFDQTCGILLEPTVIGIKVGDKIRAFRV